MKKISLLITCLLLITIFSFTSKRAYNTEKKLPLKTQQGQKKNFCGTSFNSVVANCTTNSPTITSITISSIISFYPNQVCNYNTSTYLGTTAFTYGYYDVTITVTGAFNFIFITDHTGFPLTTTIPYQSGQTTYQFNNLYLIGCGENYTIGVRANQ